MTSSATLTRHYGSGVHLSGTEIPTVSLTGGISVRPNERRTHVQRRLDGGTGTLAEYHLLFFRIIIPGKTSKK